MEAQVRMNATGEFGLAEVFGRDLEMRETLATEDRHRTHDQALSDLLAESDRVGDALMVALDRMAKARSYALDPESDRALAGLLFRRVAKRGTELAGRLAAIRVAAARLAENN